MRQAGGWLRWHIDDQDPGVVAAVDPADCHIARRRDYPLPDQLAMPV